MKPSLYIRARAGLPLAFGLMLVAPAAAHAFFINEVATRTGTLLLPTLREPLTLDAVADESASAPAPLPSLPSLPALFAAALDNADELKRQRLEAEAQGEDVAKARAGLKPSLDASYAYSYSETSNYYSHNAAYDPSQTSQNPLSGEITQPYADYDARYRGRTKDSYWQARLSQPLFSVERWRSVAKARAQRDAAQLRLDVAERDLALQTAEAYMNAFYASQQTRLLDAKRKALELQLRQASRAYELGIGDRIDMLAARARLDQASADRAVADNQLSDALSLLERLTGRHPDFSGLRLNALAEIDLPAAAALETLEARVDDNREVLLAEQQLAVARAERDVRRGDYYPEVNMSLTYGNRHSNDVFRASEDTVAAVQASVNLYRGGYTSANVRQAELLQQAQLFAVSSARKSALQELRRRHRNIAGDLAQLRALTQAIRSGELYLEAADKGAALGLRDLVDVLDARAELFDRRIQFVDAFRRLLIDRLNMQAAIGALSTADLDATMALIATLTAR